jgi:hypothetical protein
MGACAQIDQTVCRPGRGPGEDLVLFVGHASKRFVAHRTDIYRVEWGCWHVARRDSAAGPTADNNSRANPLRRSPVATNPRNGIDFAAVLDARVILKTDVEGRTARATAPEGDAWR